VAARWRQPGRPEWLGGQPWRNGAISSFRSRKALCSSRA
jgi:hypothetical protein